jgi:enterochelin esterase-like enzyme
MRKHLIRGLIFLGIFLVTIVPGCSSLPQILVASDTATPVPQPSATSTPFVPLKPTSTPLPSETPTITHSPTVTSTPEPTACQELHGKIQAFSIQTNPFPRALEGHIYLPPCYTSQPERRYPLLILLHGQTYTDEQWLDLGITDFADRMISSAEIPPLLIAMPREDYYLQDPFSSIFGSEVVDELLPWLETEMGACRERTCHAIGGISRGGAWALHIGITNLQQFGIIGGHSTPPFDPYNLTSILRDTPPEDLPAIFLDIGDWDPYRPYALSLHQALDGYGIPHTWKTYSGNHNDQYWAAHVEEYLGWYGGMLEAADK